MPQLPLADPVQSHERVSFTKQVPLLRAFALIGLSVPEGRVENSPGWSAAEPWDGRNHDGSRPVEPRRDIRRFRIHLRAIALLTDQHQQDGTTLA